jgi:hypothetical protein
MCVESFACDYTKQTEVGRPPAFTEGHQHRNLRHEKGVVRSQQRRRIARIC